MSAFAHNYDGRAWLDAAGAEKFPINDIPLFAGRGRLRVRVGLRLRLATVHHDCGCQI